MSKDKETQNHINFYLTLSDFFKRHREDEHFHARWSVDDTLAEKVHDSLKKLYSSLNDEDLIAESAMVRRIKILKTLDKQFINVSDLNLDFL